MALQNFIDTVTKVSTNWLNTVDVLLDTVFEGAQTKVSARTALELGNASLLDVGTTPGTAAAGDDPRLIKANRLPSDDGNVGEVITSNGDGTSAWAAAGGGSVFSTMQDMTGSRALTTPYQNTSSSPMYVSITSDFNDLQAVLIFYISSDNITYTPVFQAITQGVLFEQPISVAGIVPAGWWYQLADGGAGSPGTITGWMEIT